jgi:hypothetical protein
LVKESIGLLLPNLLTSTVDPFHQLNIGSLVKPSAVSSAKILVQVGSSGV